MAIPKNSATLAVIIALLGSGCTQPDPNAAPSYTCTPSDGGTAQPCYKAEYDQKIKEDALYAEAEAVYRKFLAEDERIHRVGGASAATPVLLATTTGSYLESAMTVYKALKAAKATASGGEFKIAWVRREPRLSMANSLVALTACTDTSSVQMGSQGKTPLPGRISERTVYFVREADQLKITDGTYKLVDQC
ncbi:MAG TPA: hypothetical protein DCM67_04130 [Propionibacteriaceae bacterium]|nr:hypothetical protein [Propionibacteriaceae bacterium]